MLGFGQSVLGVDVESTSCLLQGNAPVQNEFPNGGAVQFDRGNGKVRIPLVLAVDLYRT